MEYARAVTVWRYGRPGAALTASTSAGLGGRNTALVHAGGGGGSGLRSERPDRGGVHSSLVRIVGSILTILLSSYKQSPVFPAGQLANFNQVSKGTQTP